jgi:hypothetical protein
VKCVRVAFQCRTLRRVVHIAREGDMHMHVLMLMGTTEVCMKGMLPELSLVRLIRGSTNDAG